MLQHHHQALCRHNEHMVILVSIKRMSSFESICVSVCRDTVCLRTKMEGTTTTTATTMMMMMLHELLQKSMMMRDTSCVVVCIEMMKSISTVQ